MLTTENSSLTNLEQDFESRGARLTPRFPASLFRPSEPADKPLPERDSLAVFCFEDLAGSVGRSALSLARALSERGNGVHLFVRQCEENVPGITLHVLGDCDAADPVERAQEFGRRACNAFLQTFSLGAPVHLVGFEWSSLPPLTMLNEIQNVRFLLSVHSLECQRSDMSSAVSRRIDDIERNGLQEARAVLVHDETCGRLVRSLVPGHEDKVAAIREIFATEALQTGIDPGAIKANYQVGPLDPVILFIGDFSETYGPDMLVKALPPVLKNHSRARLLLVGEGQLYWPLRVFARYLLLEHAVNLVGSLEGTPLFELIQAADVVVVPSRGPTPWWPILAAWAAGTPVVATHDAAPGLLSHEQDAVLTYASENSLVWGIERVLYDAGLQQSLIAKGREKLAARFGWNSVAVQVEELAGIKV